MTESIDMIFVTLDDLTEDIDEICRLARKFDGEIVLALGSDYEDKSMHNLNTMTKKPETAPERAGQKGFTMVELMIAVTLISIVLLAVGALTSLSANGMALVLRKRAAENYAVELSSRLKANQKIMMPEGGAFAVDPVTGDPVRATDATVALNCTEMYCDRVITIPSETEGASATEMVYSWNGSLPEGASVKFVRAWTLSDEDARRNWRRITVAVFSPDSQIPTTYSVTGGVIK